MECLELLIYLQKSVEVEKHRRSPEEKEPFSRRPHLGTSAAQGETSQPQWPIFTSMAPTDWSRHTVPCCAPYHEVDHGDLLDGGRISLAVGPGPVCNHCGVKMLCPLSSAAILTHRDQTSEPWPEAALGQKHRAAPLGLEMRLSPYHES